MPRNFCWECLVVLVFAITAVVMLGQAVTNRADYQYPYQVVRSH